MQEDDFGPIYELPELQGLLFEPPERYSTPRLLVRLNTDGKLMTEAARCQRDFEAEHGMTFYLYTADAKAEDRVPKGEVLWYSVFFDSEEWTHLWHERPNRWREETERPHGSRSYEVIDGRRYWQHHPPYWRNHYGEDDRQDYRGWPSLSLLVAPEVLGERLFAEALVRVVGRGKRLGRETLEAGARIRSRGYPPDGLTGKHGADTFAHSVDVRTGVVLRFSKRLEDREFYVAEVTEIAFEEDLPEGTFQPGWSQVLHLDVGFHDATGELVAARTLTAICCTESNVDQPYLLARFVGRRMRERIGFR